jgi:hypothetical protein
MQIIITDTATSYQTMPGFNAITGSRNSAVGMETGYGLNERGVGIRVPVEIIFYFPPRRPCRF